MPECYGAVLLSCKLLPGSARSAFMRDVFDHFAYRLSDCLARSYWADMTMRDSVKRYIAANIRRHEVWATGTSNFNHYDVPEDKQVFQRALSLMKWDVVLADLIVFYHWRNDSPAGIIAAIALIEGGNHRPEQAERLRDFRVRFPRRPEVTAEESKASLHGGMLIADDRQNLTLLGIMVRAGALMTWP